MGLFETGVDEAAGVVEHTPVGVRRAVNGVQALMAATARDVAASPLPAKSKADWAKVDQAWRSYYPNTQGWSGFKAQFLDQTYDAASRFAGLAANARRAVANAGGALTPVPGYADAPGPSKEVGKSGGGAGWKLPSLPKLPDVSIPWGKILIGLGVVVGGWAAWTWWSGRKAREVVAAPGALVNNPPEWALDSDMWERAKLAVAPSKDRYANPEAVTTHVYKQLGGRVGNAETVVLVDDGGRSFGKPARGDFNTDWEYARAFHDYNNRVTSSANRSFDKQFRKSLR